MINTRFAQTSLYKIDISGWSTSHMVRFANAVRQSLIINPLLVKHNLLLFLKKRVCSLTKGYKLSDLQYIIY